MENLKKKKRVPEFTIEINKIMKALANPCISVLDRIGERISKTYCATKATEGDKRHEVSQLKKK